jgi:NAD(P)-dependent dehydrogenase (short-subunit alcohol dehydrogenase family)
VIHVDGLDGRVAVVTGAARGIGRRIAEVLAEHGARVAVLDVNPSDLDGVLGIECDVSDAEAVDQAFSDIETRLGAPSVLVIGAAISPVVPFEQTSPELWERTLAINLTGAFLVARRALPGMRAQGYGRIVGIGASAGKGGGSGSIAAYAASKAGVMTLMKSIANEYARYGITANALAPAYIDTGVFATTREVAAQIPVGRYGTVDEVAAAAVFLCSSHAGYITGEIVDINGGTLMD